MVENEGGAPGATAASSNGPSGNLSIKILLNYKDTQETNSSSQPKKKKKTKTTKEVTTSSSSAGGAFPSHYCPFSDQTSMTLELVRAHLAHPLWKNSLLLNATRPLSVSLPRVYFPANESFHLPTSGVLIKVP